MEQLVETGNMELDDVCLQQHSRGSEETKEEEEGRQRGKVKIIVVIYPRSLNCCNLFHDPRSSREAMTRHASGDGALYWFGARWMVNEGEGKLFSLRS
ncbi:hypothetical protein DPX16_12976 [Anabarilius grahami]|uniref:Uncharacterized protein n=1 Tax=Anabarilius grahami TaxID=495550 RepID=A0A3N0XDI6_ANAGA|nr:hypothetical protein DPX16_12976 [Anabarilius grahami]